MRWFFIVPSALMGIQEELFTSTDALLNIFVIDATEGEGHLIYIKI